jgi:hypothetical protein
MGLLDDAIKEHLELKRRRGADPGEIERQESEALGPVRRGEVDLADRPVARAAVEDPAPDDADFALDDEPSAPSRAPEPESERESTSPPHGDPLGDEALGRHDRPPVEETADHGTVTPPHGDALAQPTRQFSVDEVQEALGRDRDRERDARPAADPDVVPAEADAEEDVLEETPEFLQETPEHDRLWFEQKPPKDFDF